MTGNPLCYYRIGDVELDIDSTPLLSTFYEKPNDPTLQISYDEETGLADEMIVPRVE